MSSSIEKVKEQVSVYDVVTEFWERPNRENKVKCPFHMEKTASLSINTKTNRWHCFGCGKDGDVIDFVKLLNNVSTMEAVRLIADRFNISLDRNYVSKKTVRQTDNNCPVQVSNSNIPEYLERCSQDVMKTDFFYKRGLDPETIERFKLGYDTKKNLVTIPYNSALTYYQTRSIEDKHYYKPRAKVAGSEPIFNAERITKKGQDTLFIVESPICAISIEQCGGRAIALGGTGGWRKVSEAISEAKYKGRVILALDNDNAGMDASKALLSALVASKIDAIEINIAAECKDPNDLLMLDRERLKANINNAMSEQRDITPVVDIKEPAPVVKAEDTVNFMVLLSKPKSTHILLKICFVDDAGNAVRGAQHIDEIIALKYNSKTGTWDLEGSKKGIQKDRLWKEYEDSPYIKTIKILLDKNKDIWSGTSSQLIGQVEKELGIKVTDNATAVGKKIGKYDTCLMIDGIMHILRKEGRSRVHTFKNKKN